VSKKSARIAAVIEQFQGREYDAHYLGFFDLFNGGLFYESHDVLEELWLAERRKFNGAFYKGLIQLAGAFVHLQKDRLRPAAALFKLARANLESYSPLHEGLAVTTVLGLIEDWLGLLEGSGFKANPLHSHQPPELRLMTARE